MLVASSSAFIDGIERFARVASDLDDVPRVLVRAISMRDSEACGAELRGRLEPFIPSPTALKPLEMPRSALNPERVRQWLETSSPHISLTFSPLKERGPPLP
jgi:hypothetical protein